jgi:predicted RNase H-like nuclease (RuvC/YqgF family)
MTDTTQPTYDIAAIRKAYNRVQDALTQAKAARDQERAAKCLSDFLALKQLLADAKESQDDAASRGELRQEIRELKARLSTAETTITDMRTTISGLKYQLELAEDEVRTLRSPLPTSTQRAYTTAPAPTPTIDFDALFDELK